MLAHTDQKAGRVTAFILPLTALKTKVTTNGHGHPMDGQRKATISTRTKATTRFKTQMFVSSRASQTAQ